MYEIRERPDGPWCERHTRQRDYIVEWCSGMLVFWIACFVFAVAWFE